MLTIEERLEIKRLRQIALAEQIKADHQAVIQKVKDHRAAQEE